MASIKIPMLTIATNNPHKLREFRRLFPDFQVLSPQQIDCPFSFEETGTTYLENALGKALHLYQLAGTPVLADDSGLEVVGLGGEPGVYSSRYGSANGRLSDFERNAYLLNRAATIIAILRALANDNQICGSMSACSWPSCSNRSR